MFLGKIGSKSFSSLDKRKLIDIKIINTILFAIVYICLLTGCFFDKSSDNQEAFFEKNAKSAAQRGHSNNHLKHTIASLEGVSDSQIVQDIILYKDTNPESIEYLICYLLKTREMQNNIKVNYKNNMGEVVLNSIPILGAAIIDYDNGKFVDKYGKQLVDMIDTIHDNRNETLREILQSYVKAGKIRAEDADIFFTKNELKNNIDIDMYNIMVKIAVLLYRETEAVIEDSKVRFGVEPDIFDIVDVVSYELFFKEENKQKIQSARNSLKAIYESFNLIPLFEKDENYTYSKWANIHYGKIIPLYMFPYKIEASFRENDIGKIKYNSSLSKAGRRRLYSFLNGTWVSLQTGESFDIFENHYIDGEMGRNAAIGYIDCSIENVPFAVFRYKDKRTMIIPAIYINEDNSRENVLVMYIDYQYLNSDGVDKDRVDIERYQTTNIRQAKDVLIKRADASGNFEVNFDPIMYAKNNTKEYYMSDKLITNFFPYNQDEFVFSWNSPAVLEKMNLIFKGVWISLITGKELPIDANRKQGDFGYVTCMSKDYYYAIFDYKVDNNNSSTNPYKKILLTPALCYENGEYIKVLVAYINYQLIENIENDMGNITVYNWRVDNIKDAEDVWIQKY